MNSNIIFVLFYIPCVQIRQQNRQDMKTAGPQSQVLASVTENCPPVSVRVLHSFINSLIEHRAALMNGEQVIVPKELNKKHKFKTSVMNTIV